MPLAIIKGQKMGAPLLINRKLIGPKTARRVASRFVSKKKSVHRLTKTKIFDHIKKDGDV